MYIFWSMDFLVDISLSWCLSLLYVCFFLLGNCVILVVLYSILLLWHVDRKVLGDTLTYMNCLTSISTPNLVSQLNTQLILMYFPNRRRFLVKQSRQGKNICSWCVYSIFQIRYIVQSLLLNIVKWGIDSFRKQLWNNSFFNNCLLVWVKSCCSCKVQIWM